MIGLIVLFMFYFHFNNPLNKILERIDIKSFQNEPSKNIIILKNIYRRFLYSMTSVDYLINIRNRLVIFIDCYDLKDIDHHLKFIDFIDQIKMVTDNTFSKFTIISIYDNFRFDHLHLLKMFRKSNNLYFYFGQKNKYSNINDKSLIGHSIFDEEIKEEISENQQCPSIDSINSIQSTNIIKSKSILINRKFIVKPTPFQSENQSAVPTDFKTSNVITNDNDDTFFSHIHSDDSEIFQNLKNILVTLGIQVDYVKTVMISSIFIMNIINSTDGWNNVTVENIIYWFIMMDNWPESSKTIAKLYIGDKETLLEIYHRITNEHHVSEKIDLLEIFVSRIQSKIEPDIFFKLFQRLYVYFYQLKYNISLKL